MTSSQRRKWGLAGLVVILVLIAGGIIGFRVATGILRDRVVKALGPGSEVAAIRVGWSGVEVHGLRIKAPQGWPAPDTLRAERVTVVPSVRSLLSDAIQVGSITVVRPYLSALRARDGKIRILPGLLEAPSPKGSPHVGPPAPPVTISRIRLEDGTVDLFDATVAQPPLKIRLESIQATVLHVAVPSLKGKSHFDLTAVVRGIRRDGRATIAGWAEGATKDSSVKTELRSLDLVALQPYLTKDSETRVRNGVLDLDLQSKVSRNHLRAPGKVVISDLEFAPANGAMDTFMGVPRSAVISFLKNKEHAIELDFVIEGDLNNPQFALNEALVTRMASGLAETLGVSIRGVTEGVGTLGRRGAEATGEMVKGLGGALQELFGARKSR